MRKYLLYIVLYSAAAFLFSCSTVVIDNDKKAELCKQAAEEKLGKNLIMLSNKGNTHLLFIKQEKESALNPMPMLRIMIFETANARLLLEENIPGGKAEWINDTQIEIITMPGTVSVENTNRKPGYIFDVKDEKRKEFSNIISK